MEVNVATPVFMTDSDILALAKDGRPLVNPFTDDDVQPASHDLRLSGDAISYNLSSYRLGDEITAEHHTKTTFEDLLVPPQGTVHVGLAGTISIPNDAVGFVMARSSLTRLGVIIAPIFMNPGYSGVLPIALTNAAAFPVTLVKGMRVAQLVCARLFQAPAHAYAARSGKYAGENVSPSLIHNDREIKAALERVLGHYVSMGSTH